MPLIKAFEGSPPVERDDDVSFPFYTQGPSNTDPNKLYRIVIYSADGSMNACTCLHWQNRMTDCSHIKSVLKRLGIGIK